MEAYTALLFRSNQNINQKILMSNRKGKPKPKRANQAFFTGEMNGAVYDNNKRKAEKIFRYQSKFKDMVFRNLNIPI
jgi:hypothetical protein